jgi:filamentous hemagglutinin
LLLNRDTGIGQAIATNDQLSVIRLPICAKVMALSGAVGSALNTAVTAAKDASEESNGRLAALKGVKATLGGVQATR